MPWSVAAAGVSAAGAIGGGILGANAAKSAASQQAASQQNSLNWIQQVYGNANSNLQPFIGAGQQALTSLGNFFGLNIGGGSGTQGASNLPNAAFNAYQQTPFYQFPLQQANLATNRSLAASGLTDSGGALRDLSQLNAGYASQGLGQYLSGLGSIATSGQGAAGTLAGAGVGTFPGVGAANTGIGNANAAGTVGGFNSLSTGFSNALPFLTGTPGANPSQSSYGNGTPAGGGLLGSIYSGVQNYQNSTALSNASSGVNTFNAGNPFGSS